jgi:acyl transferase domain-containing protein/NAD(P)-dependent dehydrogenase (short-subunit alcohol dehydrogenase family)/acyl carrier protein
LSDRNKGRDVAQSPIAIVGIGCVFPKAGGLQDYWANVRNGVDAITEIPESHWKTSEYFDADPKKPDMTYGRRGGFIDPIDFEPMAFGISPRDLEATDSTQLIGLHVARQALEDAGYGEDGREFDREKTSVILGVSGTLPLVIPLGARLGHPIWRKALEEAGVDPDTTEDVIERIGEGYVPWQENSFPGLLANVVAGRIANRLDLHGTNCIVDAACASSLSAVHLAALELEAGRTDMVLSGGLDTFNDIFMYMCFSKTPALSATGNARPFNDEADGTILGEGVGMVVLKRLGDAERDGDRIYAVIKGIGSSSDGKGQAVYAPASEGQARALRAAYASAGIRPDTVELVEGHGTGTRVGDATEAKGLTTVYREASEEGTWCALGSVKSMIGHTKAAAGAAGLIKTAMALHHKTLPPTIKVESPNEAVAVGETPFYVNTEKRPWMPKSGHPRRAGVSAFGFGGSNFHCVVEEYESQAPEVDWDGRDQLIAFSADGREALTAQLGAFDTTGDWSDIRGRAAESRARFDASSYLRLLLVVERDGTPLTNLISTALSQLKDERESWATPQGIYFGSGPAKGKWAACFPGQGAQYVGMLRELACRFPAASDALAAATEVTPGLADLIYPHPAFDDTVRSQQEDQLRATDTAQPAIGAVSLAAMRVLEHFGLAPDATCGHSYGELVALCAAGRLRPMELYQLSRRRGELMAVGDGDHGSMLAVSGELEWVKQFLLEHDLDLVVANHNAPEQAVLSGVTYEIERAQDLLSKADVRVKHLAVAAAFHSSLVAQAGAPFAENLTSIELTESDVPVFANATGTAYPERSTDARELLASQLTSPVEFVACVRAMFEDGVRTFVEVGPGRRLSALIDEILSGEDITTVAIDASSGRRAGLVDLARTLAQLSAEGHAGSLDRWDDGALEAWQRKIAAGKPAMTIPISGVNYVDPRPKRPPRAATPALPASTSAVAPAAVNQASPAPPASVSTADPQVLAEAMRASQASLQALFRLQEQTADVHRRFLESQERTIQAVARQQGLPPGAPAPQPVEVIQIPAPVTAPVAPPLAVPAPAPAAPIEPVPSAAPVSEPAPVTEPVVASPAPSAETEGAAAGIAAALLSVVSEKTGYPEEMLELSMGLDADLGIDSIKRVEILSALQERLPAAPVITPEHLGEIQTLGQIVDFLGGSVSESVEPSPMTDSVVEASAPTAEHPTDGAEPTLNGTSSGGLDTSRISEVLLGVVADKTGYPVDMLDVSMNLDADLGIDSIKRVEILAALQEALPNAPVVAPDQLGELRTLSQIVDVLAQGSGAQPTEPPTVEVPAATQSATVAVPEEAVTSAPVGVERLIPTLRPIEGIGDPIGLPIGSKIWVTKSGNVLSGQVVEELSAQGYSAEEVELGDQGDAPPDDVAGLIVVVPPQVTDEDILLGFGRVRAMAPVLRRAALQGGALLCSVTCLGGGFALEAAPPEDVDPTGGAWGGMIKTAAAEWSEVDCKCIDVDPNRIDLASDIVNYALADGPVEIGLGSGDPLTVYLESRPVEPATHAALGSDDVVLITGGARGVTAEVAIAMAEAGQPRLILMGRSPDPTGEPDWLIGLDSEGEIKRAIVAHAGPGVSPQEVQAEFNSILANREILRNLARISAAGSEVVYTSVDVRDPDAVSASLAPLTKELGPITGLVHGAGVLADRNIEDKSDEDFASVYGTKVGGLRSVLTALVGAPLKVMVMFSSSTARFGRKGQIDYAAANEVLNKMAQVEADRRDGCRVVSVNWGPWDGGMVTPALKGMFSEEGIEVIGMQNGAAYLLDEIACDGPTEVLILGSGSQVPATEYTPAVSTNGKTPDELPTVFERTITTDTHEFMASHVLDGRAVLPVAMTLEWLAHSALHGNPGLRFVGVDDFRVFKGVLLQSQESFQVRVCADAAQRRGEEFLVTAELCSGGSNGRRVLHARAEIVLATRQPEAATPYAAEDLPALDQSIESIYSDTLFHGPAMRGLVDVESCGDAGLVARCRVAPPPKDWMQEPVRNRWIADPLVLDSGLQAMIVWTSDRVGEASLPSRLTRYRQFVPSFPKDGARIVINVRDLTDARVVSDIDWVGDDGRLLARLEGYESVVDSSLSKAFRQNRLEKRASTKA